MGMEIPDRRGVFGRPGQQRFQLFRRILAHEANLDPVALPQIIAVVAEQVAGLLQLRPQSGRILAGRQRDGDHSGRRIGVRRDELKTDSARRRATGPKGRAIGDFAGQSGCRTAASSACTRLEEWVNAMP